MLAKQLKSLREQWKIRQEDLAVVLNVEKSAISQYETGRRVPDVEKLAKLADYFGVTVDYLLGRESIGHDGPLSLPVSNRLIPLLEAVHTGYPLLSPKNWQEEIEVPPTLKADFVLRIKEDNLSWVGIHPGDLALFEQTSAPTPEDILAVGLEADVWQPSLRYFVEQNGKFSLRSAHPDYEDVPFTDHYRVIGRLQRVIKSPPSLQQYQAILHSKDIYSRDWHNTIYKAEQYGLNSKKTLKLLESVSDFVKNTL
ncbi:HTH-type transcriptional regulator Xre [Peptococcaceae bacterium CEB3]|nr:HTH-type transcriptional regulator Xre [Peptococcaceae bacterium CEB3]